MNRDTREREDGELRDLLRGAGPRSSVPTEDLAAIKAASRREWRQRYGAATTTTSASGRRWLAAAASVLVVAGLALLAGWWWRASPTSPGNPGVLTPGVVAEVALVHGTVVEVTSGALPRVGDEIAGGAVLESEGGGAVALHFGDGGSLRLDGDSRVRLISDRTVELERGAVYWDSGSPSSRGADQDARIEIHTPQGTFWDIGTQFEVRLLPDPVEVARVRVREGEVAAVAAGEAGTAREESARRTVVSGQQLRLHGDGSARWDEVAVHGEPWTWVVASAPPLILSDTPVEVFLTWVTREGGWALDFQADEAALTATLDGDIAGLSLEEALDQVLPAAYLEHRMEAGTLVITEAPGLLGGSELPPDP